MSSISDALHNYNLRYFKNIDPPVFTATYDGSVGSNDYTYVATYVTINGETTQSEPVLVENCDTISDNDTITLVAVNIPTAVRTIKYFRKVSDDYKYIGTSTAAINSLVDNGLVPTDEEPPSTNTSGRDSYHFIGYRTDRPLQRLELIDHQAMLHNQVKDIGDTTFVNGDIISGLSLHTVDAETYKFRVDAGKIYFDGVVIDIPASDTLTLLGPPDSGVRLETVGVTVESSIVTYEDDSKLRNIDDNIPIEYYNLPGADRITTTVTWTVNDSSALVIHEFENGIQKIKPLPMERTVLTRSLAKRTQDTSGDFVSRNFQTKAVDHDTDSSKFKIVFGPGTAYVDGFRVEVPTSRSISVDKARDTDSLNGMKALKYESSGGYFVSSDGPFNVNGKALKFKFGAGKARTVSFSGTDPISAESIVSAIKAAIPWYIDNSYICEVLGPLPKGVDNRGFMFAAPRGKTLTIESVANDAYTAFGINVGAYNTSGKRIYKLRESNVKDVTDITGYCVEVVQAVQRGSGTNDYLDANLDDVVGVNTYGADVDEKSQYCNDGMFTINKAGTVGSLYVVEVEVAGSGYQVNNELSVTGGFGGIVVVNSVDGNGGVTAATVKSNYAGYGYTEGIKPTTGGSGSGCYIDVTSVYAYTISADGTDIVFSSTSYPVQGTTYYVKYSKYITPVKGTRTKVRVTNGKILKGSADDTDTITLVSDNSTTAYIITTGSNPVQTTVPVGNIRDIIDITSVNSSINGSGVEYNMYAFMSGNGALKVVTDSIDWRNCENSSSIVTGQPDTGSYYYVSFDYWRHDVEGDYLVATSYHDYNAVPLAPNKAWQLRDCIDLRPDGYKPYDGCSVFADIEYYMPRVDRLVVTNDGSFSNIKGGSAKVPSAPRDTPGSLSLAIIKIPAYTYTSSEVSIVSTEPLRITQQGIREMQKRLDRLEYLTAIKQAETNTAVSELAANSVGMFVDSCVDEGKVDKGFNIGGVVHNAAYDPVNKCYRLPVDDVVSASLVWDANESTGFRLVESGDGNIICLDYQPVIIESQVMATDTININPNPMVNYLNGNVSLTPAGDMYFDTTQLPARVSELDASIDDVLQYIAPDMMDRTDWGTWHLAGSNQPAAPPGSTISVSTRWGGTLYPTGTMTRERFFALRRSGIDVHFYDPTGMNYLATLGDGHNYSGWNYNPWPETLTPEQYRNAMNRTFQSDISYTEWNISTGEEQSYLPYSGTMPQYEYDSVRGVYRAIWPDDASIEADWARYVQEVQDRIKGGHGWVDQYSTTEEIGTSREGTRTQIVSQRQELDLGTSVVDLTSVPMMRTIDNSGDPFRIDINVTNLMPNAPHNVTIGGVSVNLRPNQGYNAGAVFNSKYSTVQTNSLGALSGYFFMPSGIPSGVREVQVKHNSGADVSSGSALFTSQGLNKAVQDNSLAITTPQVRETALTESGTVREVLYGARYVDPVGQTFLITSPTYLTGVGIYFATKPTTDIPVTCDIRKVQNGYITRETLVSATIHPANISTSTDGSVETIFTFPDILKFEPEEYAVVLTTACQDYNVYIATAGLPDLVSGSRYNAQMHGGILFQSLNNYTWEPINASDMKFRLYKANFEPEGELVFQGITGVEAGILSARINQILGPGAVASWFYQLSPTSAWVPFDPIIDQELSATPSVVRLKVKVLNSGGTFKIAVDGTSGIVLKNHKSSANYVSRKVTFADAVTQPDELVFNMACLSDGFGSEYTSGTGLVPYYSIDGGTTWCEVFIDPSFSPRALDASFKDYRFKTPGEQSIDNVSGVNGQPMVLTSLGHRFSNGQLVFVSDNIKVSSSVPWMISDRTSDTFKLRYPDTGAYLNSDGTTQEGGTCFLASFDSCIIRVGMKTISLPSTGTRPRTPMFKNLRCISNVTQ